MSTRFRRAATIASYVIALSSVGYSAACGDDDDSVEPPPVCASLADCKLEEHDLRCTNVACVNGACAIEQRADGSGCVEPGCQRATCSAGSCVCASSSGDPSQPTCYDSDPCTTDALDPATNLCTFDPIPGCTP